MSTFTRIKHPHALAKKSGNDNTVAQILKRKNWKFLFIPIAHATPTTYLILQKPGNQAGTISTFPRHLEFSAFSQTGKDETYSGKQNGKQCRSFSHFNHTEHFHHWVLAQQLFYYRSWNSLNVFRAFSAYLLPHHLLMITPYYVRYELKTSAQLAFTGHSHSEVL